MGDKRVSDVSLDSSTKTLLNKVQDNYKNSSYKRNVLEANIIRKKELKKLE